jgi:hypothetical protein
MVAMIINGLESRAGAGPLDYPMAMEEGGCMKRGQVKRSLDPFQVLRGLFSDRLTGPRPQGGPIGHSGADPRHSRNRGRLHPPGRRRGHASRHRRQHPRQHSRGRTCLQRRQRCGFQRSHRYLLDILLSMQKIPESPYEFIPPQQNLTPQ